MEFHPVDRERWDDLVDLFQGHGNPGYCWCMTWRVAGSEFRALGREGRKAALHQRVLDGQPIGLLAYQDGKPVGWCSVAPRESYGRLERSRTIHRLDQQRTWSVVCFYLDLSIRGQGLTTDFLRAAVAYAAACGAEVVEGYPIEPERDAEGNWKPTPSYRFMGFRSAYEKAGFSDVTPPGSARTIMRYDLSMREETP